MEAPEKLYLPKRNKSPLEVVRGGEWYETNPQCMYGSVEYIRRDIVDGMLATAEDHAYFAGSESQRVKLEKIKDNFIEKACRWIRENITNNPHANSVLVRNGCVTLGMLVDDFKKYMTKE